MSELNICRICLDSNVQMHQIYGSEVQDVYEKLTNTQVQDEGRLYFTCYLCYCQLKKSQQLVIKSQKSEELLKQILLNHNELNLKSIHSVDRLSYGLVTSLMISNTVSLQIPESYESRKCDDRSESDTDVMMFIDGHEDDCTDTNQECEVNDEENFTEHEPKSIQNICGTQRNTNINENASLPIIAHEIRKHVSGKEIGGRRGRGRGSGRSPQVTDELSVVRAQRARTQRRAAAMSPTGRTDLLAKQKQDQLLRMLLPDAPPRKRRAQNPSPEREPCQFEPVPPQPVLVLVHARRLTKRPCQYMNRLSHGSL